MKYKAGDKMIIGGKTYKIIEVCDNGIITRMNYEQMPVKTVLQSRAFLIVNLSIALGVGLVGGGLYIALKAFLTGGI